MKLPNSQEFLFISDAMDKIFLYRYGDLIPRGFTSDDYVKKRILEKAIMTEALERAGVGRQQLQTKDYYFKNFHTLGKSHIDQNQFLRSLFDQGNIQNQEQRRESIHSKVILICDAISLFVLHNLVSTHFPEQQTQIRKQYQRVKTQIPVITDFSIYETFPKGVPVGAHAVNENINSIAKLWYFDKLRRELKLDIKSGEDLTETSPTHQLWIGTRSGNEHATTRGWYKSQNVFIAAFIDQHDQEPGATLVCFSNLSQQTRQRNGLFKPEFSKQASQAFFMDYHLFGLEGSQALLFDPSQMQQIQTRQLQQRLPVWDQRRKGYILQKNQDNNKYKFISDENVVKVNKDLLGLTQISQNRVRTLLSNNDTTRTGLKRLVQGGSSDGLVVLHIPLNRQATATTCEYHGIENTFRLYFMFQAMNGSCSEEKAIKGSRKVDSAIHRVLDKIMRPYRQQQTTQQKQRAISKHLPTPQSLF